MRQSVQEWTQQNLWKTAFKKFEMISPASSANFAWSILDYFAQNSVDTSCWEKHAQI